MDMKQRHLLSPRLSAVILGEAANSTQKRDRYMSTVLAEILKKEAQAFIRTMGCRGAKEKVLATPL